MPQTRNCQHKWEVKGNYYICSNCKKQTLYLRETNKEGVRIGTKRDGKKYLVRTDRSRYFMPDEWNLFIESIRKQNKPFFEFMVNTGTRIDEATHVRPKDFDFDRNTVRLWKTKTKATKGETVGQPRTISISSQLSKTMKKLSKDKNPESYLFFPKEPVGKVILNKKIQAVNQMIKRKVREVEIEDWYNFASHNIRKTHGMYLKALGVGFEEICLRLAHDANTYLKHYGSASIFTEKDMRGIREILGDLYVRDRKY